MQTEFKDITLWGGLRTPGKHRRFFWRVGRRFGPGWDLMTAGQVAREMRMVSNRRA